MEDVKVKDTVMVYGYKATVEHIGEVQAGKDSPEKRKIYAVKFSNRDGYTDETESASIRIQRAFRGYRARKEFHSFVSSLVWRKFEHLHENMTLNNHDEIYKPLIKAINEDIKSGKIQFTSKCFSSNSNQFSRISTTSYESTAYDENVPKLKDKIDKAFAMEVFHFFLTTKNVSAVERWSGSPFRCHELHCHVTTAPLPRHHRPIATPPPPHCHFPNNLVCKILTKTQKMLEENIKSSVIHVDMTKKSKDTKLIILGDVHGQLNDVLWLFNRFGLPSSNNIYIFNGDIADRGENATEIFLLLFTFKLSNYDCVIINRGNHECSYMNEVYGFYNEVLSKYDSAVFDLFQGVFELLGLAVNIQSRFLC
ncbi:hypothetical protein PVMG_02799 [Plasmodium vivax Mauritania I]|uniref:Serine/threonine-protein phosphatase n=1 Tax=Plasmodium vivax Mauritania I TaxID=1035515 RepID=A0A0J9T5B0_PLAVI|nr:hypothetical protein PVMG_02799 [Plasmodium vivax Mauritania I]